MEYSTTINWFDTFPTRKYEILYIDPCWDYAGQKQHGKKGVDTGGAVSHYDTMTPAQLKALPIRDLSEKNSLLFCWTTGPQLAISIDLKPPTTKVEGF